MDHRNDDRAFIEYWFAVALSTIHENSGNLDPVSKFVNLRKAPAAVALQVFTVANIFSSMYVMPEIATSSKTGDERNE